MGRLEVVDGAGAAARAAAGGAVLVVGADAAEVGREVDGLRAAGGRAAGFVGPGGASGAHAEAVAEMAAELFPGDDVVAVVER